MKVDVLNVKLVGNPAPFSDGIKFQITIQCIEAIEDDLEWKVIYIGSPNTTDNDQELTSIAVGPIAVGTSQFDLETEGPQIDKIPTDDILGMTGVLLCCYYHDQEFIRVGYYLENKYTDPILLENPPEKPDSSKITREILDKPRVTRFDINWSKKLADGEIFIPQLTNEEKQRVDSLMEKEQDESEQDGDQKMEKDTVAAKDVKGRIEGQ
ncbi:MAG: putative Histone chaperone ASF1B [Streblomastix strix]|uniref:Putative Histone chaperone ASF1B n=1 Tax=Streblomastix strix TaxID=222440 RepID=A0A5J4VUN4_9EUKA|nr:MAG: putative Histone chaperone ASF1B [Streblomastix strix]